ncbi:hypothetical protein FH972_012752 [Carpinus fangiana]|uniref:Hydrophobic seed protein domain-containing protein n=1 Tax=Carpinus fangiana TaxID=176857 RepID=A0A5N6R7W8_9ROSI|nr:hypothetical protein FH972_012752 [Carpinus fangiana]
MFQSPFMLQCQVVVVPGTTFQCAHMGLILYLCPLPTTPKGSQTPSPRWCPSLGVCANLLNDLVHLVVGTPPKTPCCSLIQDLVDLEAAVCLCTSIKANVLGTNLNVPVSLSLLLNYCV